MKKRRILIGSLLFVFWKKKVRVDCLLGFCRNLPKVAVLFKKVVFLTKSEQFFKLPVDRRFEFWNQSNLS